MNSTQRTIMRNAIAEIDAGRSGAYGHSTRSGDRGYLSDALAGPVDAETLDDALAIATEYLPRIPTGMIVEISAREVQAGDTLLGWTSSSGETVNVFDEDGVWLVDGTIHRPEDSPSYRRHRHGEVQLLFADSRMDIEEGLPVTVCR